MKITDKYIQCYTHNNGRIGVLVEFGLESSMPQRSDEFRKLSVDLAIQIAALKPSDVDELLKQEYIKDPSINVGNLIKQVSVKIAEELQVTRFIRWDIDTTSPESEEPPPKSPAVAMRVVK